MKYRPACLLSTKALINQGYDLNKVAATLGFTLGTILRYVGILIINGEKLQLNVYDYVEKPRADLVVQAFKDLGVSKLKPVMEKLGENNFTYDELQLVRILLFTSSMRFYGSDLSFTNV
jgi:ATP-dependent DNA helicase RecQ